MEINWVQIGIGALTGGLAGNLIKQFFDNRRNKLQPITYTIDLKPFYDSYSHTIIPSRIILKENNQEYPFSNLVIGKLLIKNAGIFDFPSFSIGLTLDDDAKIINIKQEDSHRHHSSTFSIIPMINNQTSILDITLEPFNRKNVYEFNFLISVTGYYPTVEDMTFEVTSKQAVKLLRIKNNKNIDLALEIVKPIMELGPIKISLGK